MDSIIDYKNILRQLFLKIEERRQLFLLYPANIDTVHDLRVSIRELRSLISFIKPLMIQKSYSNIQSKWRNIHQQFSALRNYDVLIEQSLAYENVDKLIMEVIIQRRDRQRQACVEYAKHLMVEQLIVAQKDLLALVDKIQPIDFNQFITNRFIAWNDSLDKSVSKINNANRNKLHRCRIQFKKLRYVKYYLKDSLDLTKMKKIQTLLGDINDTYVAVDYLNLLKQDNPELIFAINDFINFQLAQQKKLFKQMKEVL